MNNFIKILLLVITFLLVVIYFQNVSLKREIENLKIKIEEIKSSEISNPSLEEKPTEKKLIYIGNSKTLKFHQSDCQWAKKINPANKVYFNSKEEALKKGYQPCKICNP
ncbi:MAG: Ada metal-binding domain-containing protein [candidate division WOR-3 bacterium]